MISKETIRQIKDKLDLVELISNYVVLKKKGKNWQGLCPFHPEKTPSFTVSPEKMIWHCFGCGMGGNAFDFMMKINNESFEGAIKELAEKLGIEITEIASSNQNKGELNKYYKILKDAEDFFSRCLKEDENKKAINYLEKRKIPKESINYFGIGYAPSAWQALFKEFSKKYSPHNLQEVGLIIKKEGSSEYLDRFRDRIIFPIKDNRGKTIAFGGRLIEEEMSESQPKYLNSPETLVYSKSKNLYGLDLARRSISKNNEVIIAEGYLDVIMLHAFGFTNAVGTLGTALTNEHIYLLGKQINNIYLSFDSDKAGKDAALRAGEILKKRNMKVKVINLDKKDPLDTLVEGGKEKFIENIKEAQPYLEYCINHIITKYNLNEIEEVAQAINDIVDMLKKEKEKLIKEKYAKDAAKKLKIDSNIILNKLNEDFIYRNKLNNIVLSKPKKNKYFKAEEILLMSMAAHVEFREKIFNEIKVEDFINESHLKLAKIFSESTAPLDDIFENINDIEAKKMIREISLKEEDIYDDLINGCIKTIKEYHFKIKTKKVLNEINEAEKTGNYDYAKIKKLEYQDLYKQLEVLDQSKIEGGGK